MLNNRHWNCGPGIGHVCPDDLGRYSDAILRTASLADRAGGLHWRS